MTDVLAWLFVIEVIAFAFLPLTFRLLHSLPDRGYIFAKILGVLAVTYLVWIVGNFVAVVRSPVLPYLILLAIATSPWWLWATGTLATLREVAKVAVLEEAIFIGALVVYAILRVHVFGSAITHTEQFMDMALLNASLKSASYPALDPWMSGHTINYYYFGYLMFATLTKMSTVSPAAGYNLSLAYLFGFTLAGSFSIGYALTRRFAPALLAPAFVGLTGNWHGLLWQIPHSGCANNAGAGMSDFWGWFWPSTRVVASNYTLSAWSCASSGHDASNTINEYPLFSFVLGDLHPHVMSLPVVLLVIALGASLLFSTAVFRVSRDTTNLIWFAAMALSVGALFTINSWDFPTYLLVAAACIVVTAYVNDDSRDWWKAPIVSIAALTGVSLVLFSPFYLHFRSLSNGIGFVNTPSDPFEFIQVFGFLILVSLLLVGTLAVFLAPAEDVEESGEIEPSSVQSASREVGQFRVILAALAAAGAGLAGVALLGGWVPGAVFILLVAFFIWTLLILWRVINTDDPNRSDALALICVLVAIFVLGLTEIVYVKDVFQGGTSYRMNTVFKFYYQAWVLLGLAAAYSAYRVWHIVRTYFSRQLSWVLVTLVAIGTLGSGIYLRFVPSADVALAGSSKSLDGSAWISGTHPGDFAAINWLRSHAQGTPVLLEETKGEYGYDSRISTFTGLPAVMGWAGHEDQWRINDAEISMRVNDIRTMYTSGNARTVQELLRKYDVRYAIVGDQERTTYGASAGSTFARFMHIAFSNGGTLIYMR